MPFLVAISVVLGEHKIDLYNEMMNMIKKMNTVSFIKFEQR